MLLNTFLELNNGSWEEQEACGAVRSLHSLPLKQLPGNQETQQLCKYQSSAERPTERPACVLPKSPPSTRHFFTAVLARKLAQWESLFLHITGQDAWLSSTDGAHSWLDIRKLYNESRSTYRDQQRAKYVSDHSGSELEMHSTGVWETYRHVEIRRTLIRKQGRKG